VGFRLAKGESLEAILADLGATAEGVTTTRSVWNFAQSHQVSMPITESVDQLLSGGKAVDTIIHELMTR
jgi:glycerol-3-phosphate dehydrogenase (NAD(P)+)